MKPLLRLLTAGTLLQTALGLAAEPPPSANAWAFDTREGGLALRLEGRQVAEFVYRDPRILRPFFANLRTPNGLAVTRQHPPIAGTDATDHDTMHPGVWLAFGDINGQDFWRNRGRLEHVRFIEPPVASREQLTFTAECRLLAADGVPLGSLTNRYTLVALPDAWLLIWEVRFYSERGALAFGDQEEMGFGARVATPITEKNGGVLTNSAGLVTAKSTWGQPAAWCDYSGAVDGQPAGLALMSDPSNFRPAWWHNRDYGLMVANPFGQAAMQQGAQSTVILERGRTMRLRFGAAVHQGGSQQPGQLYGAFLEALARDRPR